MGKIVVRGGGAWAGDGVDVSAFGGEAARVRIFEGNGFVAAEAETVEDEFIEVGLRFGRRGVFAAGDEGEAIHEAEAGEVGVAPSVRRVGSEGDGKSEGAGGVEEGDDAGENRLSKHQRVFDRAAFELKRGVVSVGAKSAPRVECVVCVSNAADKDFAVEGHGVVGVNNFVGVDEGSFGVEDEAVEVEDKGTNHEQELTEHTGRTEATA